MERAKRGASSGGGAPHRRTKAERRIAAVLSYVPPAREQLLAAIEDVGGGFTVGQLVAAATGDARARNRIAALERDFELLVNWLEELAARGLAEAQRRGAVEKTTGTAFERLADARAISKRSAERLSAIRAIRDDLQHAYTPEQMAPLLHSGVAVLLDELDRFVDRYEKWARGGGLKV